MANIFCGSDVTGKHLDIDTTYDSGFVINRDGGPSINLDSKSAREIFNALKAIYGDGSETKAKAVEPDFSDTTDIQYMAIDLADNESIWTFDCGEDLDEAIESIMDDEDYESMDIGMLKLVAVIKPKTSREVIR